MADDDWVPVARAIAVQAASRPWSAKCSTYATRETWCRSRSGSADGRLAGGDERRVLAPTGAPIGTEVIDILTLTGGRISSIGMVADELGALTAVDAVRIVGSGPP